VGLGALAIRDAGRRKLERGAIGVRERYGEQLHASFGPPLEACDGVADRRDARVVAAQAPNHQHRAHGLAAHRGRERVDARAARRKPDVEDFRRAQRQRKNAGERNQRNAREQHVSGTSRNRPCDA
jgi:hypothetical protein